MTELEPGDFLYQSDQELFLVVIEKNESTCTFAAHGWREIDNERIDEYVKDSQSKIHKQETIEQLVEEEGDENMRRKLNKLKQLFAVYEKIDVPESGPHREFSLKEE